MLKINNINAKTRGYENFSFGKNKFYKINHTEENLRDDFSKNKNNFWFPYSYNSNQINFGMNNNQKIINALLNEKNNIKKIKIRFREILNIYTKELGFIPYKSGTGSHLQVKKTIDGKEYVVTIVKPHNTEDNATIFDKKRLKLILQGKYDEASKIF